MPYRLNRAPRMVNSHRTGVDFVAVHGNNHLLCTNTRVVLNADDSVSLRMTDESNTLDVITWYPNDALRACGGSASLQVRTRLRLWLGASVRWNGRQIYNRDGGGWVRTQGATVWWGTPPQPTLPEINRHVSSNSLARDEAQRYWATVANTPPEDNDLRTAVTEAQDRIARGFPPTGSILERFNVHRIARGLPPLEVNWDASDAIANVPISEPDVGEEATTPPENNYLDEAFLESIRHGP